MRSKVRRKMQLGEPPRHLWVRVKAETFYRLHERAARSNRSLNFELNEIIKSVLNEKASLIIA